MTRLEQHWYRESALTLALVPVSWLYRLAVAVRRLAYRLRILRVHRLGVPVIVVGNLTVGGTGKTPLTAWLASYLARQGLRPGVVCRGYRGGARNWPQQVRPDSDPTVVGDEAVLLARHCACPLAAGPNRVEAARALVEHAGCDVIVSDDGLQHYALGRDIEICVIDGVRGFGNGHCLPAGPLREPRRRLKRVQITVVNGIGGPKAFSMKLRPGTPVNLVDEHQALSWEELRGRQVHAVAGIGNPARFFEMLRRLGVNPIEHPFPDHHPFSDWELTFEPFGLPVLMTEKDAVKCRRFATSGHWYVPVTVELDSRFAQRLSELLERKG